jgi:hypothetical protein
MKLRNLYEESGKTASFALGRMNPATNGHELLVNAVKAQPGDSFLFLTDRAAKLPTDPLSSQEKLDWARKSFDGISIALAKNISLAAHRLYKLGYTEVTFLEGERKLYQILVDYNGKTEGKRGPIEFPYKFDKINYVQLERDAQAADATGMSGTKLRGYVENNDLEGFKSGVTKLAQPHAEEMFMKLRQIMGQRDENLDESIVKPFIKITKNAIQYLLRDVDDGKVMAKQAHELLDQELDDMVQDGYKEVADQVFRKKAHGYLQQGINGLELKDKDDIAQFVKQRKDIDKIGEIMSFGIKRSPKKATIKKKMPKIDDDSLNQKVQDRLAKIRKDLAKKEGLSEEQITEEQINEFIGNAIKGGGWILGQLGKLAGRTPGAVKDIGVGVGAGGTGIGLGSLGVVLKDFYKANQSIFATLGKYGIPAIVILYLISKGADLYDRFKGDDIEDTDQLNKAIADINKEDPSFIRKKKDD